MTDSETSVCGAEPAGDTLPWTREEAGDFQTACQLTGQIMDLNAQRIAVWKRFCQSRDARRAAAREGRRADG